MNAAAAAGVGLVLTGPFLVADLLASGALVPLLPGYRVQGVEINAFYPYRRHLCAPDIARHVRARARIATGMA